MVHESLLEDVIEQVAEDIGDKLGIMVVGDTDRSQGPSIERAVGKGMVIHWWEEIWDAAELAVDKINIAGL